METTDSPDLVSTTPGADAPPQSTRRRRVIHITCSVHGGCRGFTNLVVTNATGPSSWIRTGPTSVCSSWTKLRPPSSGRFSGSRSGERAISEGHGSSASGRLGGRAGLRDKRVCDGLRRPGQLVGPAAGTVSCRVQTGEFYASQDQASLILRIDHSTRTSTQLPIPAEHRATPVGLLAGPDGPGSPC
jgi:hypothetical protein